MRYRVTTIRDLTNLIQDLRPDAIKLLTQESVKQAMHDLGFTSYERLTDQDVDCIIERVVNTALWL